MAQQCGFFNAEYHDGEYDRVYNAEQFAAYFASFIGNGIFGDSMEELVVLARTENNMSVDVSTGQAWINGWWYRNDETLNMPIALADGTLNRKDIVVLRWGNAERDMWLQVLQGEPSIEAIPPVIRRDADYFDLELCEIDVPAGTSKITQALIKDTRLDNNVCGFVTGVVDQIDTTALYLQFNQQFNDWFEAVKEQFEGDVPEILQAQIDDLFGIISDRIEKTSTSQHAYLNKDYFIYNNELCKATKSIAIGDTISPGTGVNDNCIYTTITQEIKTGGVTVVEELADIIAMTVFNGEAAGAKAVKNLNTGVGTKVNKSGDIMTGDLTIQKANPGFVWLDMNGNNVRRRVFVGITNSRGDFYIYDNTNGKDIIVSTLAGVSTFNGRFADGAGYEKLNVTYGISGITDKKYWAYRIGNLVYVNIRGILTAEQPAGFPLAKLTRSDGTVIKPIIDNGNISYAQVLGGNGATANNSNGFNIVVNSALAAGSGINVFGVFMCQ